MTRDAARQLNGLKGAAIVRGCGSCAGYETDRGGHLPFLLFILFYLFRFREDDNCSSSELDTVKYLS